MKRALVTIALLVLLTVPAAAFADRPAPATGSLVVQNASGSLYINAKGGIIGRFDQGTITVFDATPGDGKQPLVTGYAQVRPLLSEHSIKYIGQNMHFYVGGSYKVWIDAIGINLSAVGKGVATIGPSGFADPGYYRVNGGPRQQFPDSALKITLGSD